MSHLKASFSNRRIKTVNMEFSCYLLKQISWITTNQEKQIRESLSRRLTKIETMKITTPTVDWISDLNIIIIFANFTFQLSFLFLQNYCSFKELHQTRQHNLVLNAIHLSMSWYGMKNTVSCFIFSTLQNELIQHTMQVELTHWKNCSLYDWYIKIQLMILMI